MSYRGDKVDELTQKALIRFGYTEKTHVYIEVRKAMARAYHEGELHVLRKFEETIRKNAEVMNDE